MAPRVAYRAETERRGGRRVVAAGVLVLVPLLGILALRELDASAGGEGDHVDVASTVEVAPPAPALDTAEVPPPPPPVVVDERSRSGAVAAATRHLDAVVDPGLLVSPARRRAVARSVAVPAYAPRLEDRLERGYGEISARLGVGDGPAPLLRLLPVGHRVEAFGRGRARVAVWQVVLLAPPGAAEATATWATSRVELRWTGRGWRVARFGEDRAGPAPRSVSPATPAAALGAAARGFSAYRR